MAVTHTWHDARTDMRELAGFSHLEAARQAFLGLWAISAVAPFLVGLDMVAGVTSTQYEGFLADWVNRIIPGTPTDAVMAIGVAAMVIAALMFFMPRVGGVLLALLAILGAASILTIGGMPLMAGFLLAGAAVALCTARFAGAYD